MSYQQIVAAFATRKPIQSRAMTGKAFAELLAQLKESRK